MSWQAGKIKCDLCAHESIAVYPSDLDRLECNNCGNMSLFEELEPKQK